MFMILQLRRPSEYVPSAIHPTHPIYPNNRLRTFSQFVRVIEETDMQLQRSMRGATRVCLVQMTPFAHILLTHQLFEIISIGNN